MKPLVVLLGVFGISCLASFMAVSLPDYYFCGRLAMAVMLMFTAIAHFKFTDGMVMMMPPVIPFKKAIVHITGYIEILTGIALLINKLRYPFAWFVILFFILLLPANIYAAQKRVNLETADFNGNGLSYLWFRIPLQLFFICWMYYFGVIH